MNDPAKPGYESSEFWLTLLTALGPVLALAFKDKIKDDDLQAILQVVSTAIAAVVTAAYTISRSLVKRGHIAAQATVQAAAQAAPVLPQSPAPPYDHEKPTGLVVDAPRAKQAAKKKPRR